MVKIVALHRKGKTLKQIKRQFRNVTMEMINRFEKQHGTGITNLLLYEIIFWKFIDDQ